MIDVASLYPSLMILYGYLSRNVKEPNRYREIYETNLEMKKSKDPRRPAYKLVCNTTYGSMKDRYNNLYDPLQANNVCVGGQLLLLDLMEHLEGHCQLIQSNTDGLLVKLTSDGSDVRAIVTEWEQRTGLRMEYTEFSEVWQKDVNNYLARQPDGRIKSKGSYVKKLSDLDNDLPIVNEALRALMVDGVPIRETIQNCEELAKFQKIVHVSSKYLYATLDGVRQSDRTFRVFASRTVGGPICKVKREGGTQEKFANTPDRCFIVNEDVHGKKTISMLDKGWYIMMAENRAKEFGL